MGESLTIRKAEQDDVQLLYHWSNDELVRKQSFSSEKILFKTHAKWFEGKLKNENSLIYIIEKDKDPTSLVRFDIGEEFCVIGVSIASDYRGKGLGSSSIIIGVNEYFKRNSLPVLASIKKDNIASIKSFQKAGFVFMKNEAVDGIESVVYQREKK